MTLPTEMASNELSSSPGLLLPVSNNATCSSSPTTITAQQTHLMASINQKFNTSQALIEDPRALQLALELSMAGLNTNFNKQLNQVQEESFPLQQMSQSSQMNSSEVFDLNVISAAVAAAAAAQQNGNDLAANNVLLAPIEDRSKKSQNMTECVPVPSSEHVAEIVGRQGCKIKALRAKTNTYIKTPVRNEEPVFVVTGRKEDVAKAKREILSAAEHFSLIRATRKSSLRGVGISSNGNVAANVGNGSADAQNGRVATGPPIFPGQITIYVRVPYRVVGLVVGPKGATIKHIQQETQTYIVTPSREKEPVFEVTGLPENVQTARKQIEAHIALRTGALQSMEDEAEALKGASTVENNTNGFGTMHTINSLSQILNENINQEFLDSLYKNGICSSFEYLEGGKKTGAGSDMQILKDGIKSANACTNGAMAQRTLPNCNFVSNIMLTNMDDSNEIESNMQQQKQIDTETLNMQQQQQQKKQQQQQKDVFVGVNNSQTVLNNHVIMTASTHVAATRSCSSASSTTSSKSANNSSGSNSGSGGSTCSSRPELLGFWKNLGDSLESDEVGVGSSSIVWQTQATTKGISPTDLLFGARDQIGNENTPSQNDSGNGITSKNITAYLLKCVLCNKKDVAGALLPCGHNIFCIECAGVHSCPMCNQNVYQQQSSRPSLPLP